MTWYNSQGLFFVFCGQLRKQQQQVIDTLESMKIPFEKVDISDPCREEDRKFMRANSKGRKEGAVPLPPQIFNQEDYCGV